MDQIRTLEGRLTATDDAAIDATILHRTEKSVVYYASHPEEIPQRLRELDEEWSAERALEANAAGVALAGATFGLFRKKRWLLLSGIVSGLLMQHAVQGWSPAVRIFRGMGIRSKREIEYERYALRALRGEFDGLADSKKKSPRDRVQEVLAIMRGRG